MEREPDTVRRATGPGNGGMGECGGATERAATRRGNGVRCGRARNSGARCSGAGVRSATETRNKTGTARMPPRTREQGGTRTVGISLRPGKVSKKVFRGIQLCVPSQSTGACPPATAPFLKEMWQWTGPDSCWRCDRGCRTSLQRVSPIEGNASSLE